MTSKFKTLSGLGALLVATIISAGSANAAGAAMGAKGLQADTKPLVETVALGTYGVRRRLQNRGYYNIVFTDATLPVYRVVACKGGQRFRLDVNRFGDIMDRDRLGSCRPVRVMGRHHGPNGTYIHLEGPRRSLTIRAR